MNLNVVAGTRDRDTSSDDDVDHGYEVKFEGLVVVFPAYDWAID